MRPLIFLVIASTLLGCGPSAEQKEQQKRSSEDRLRKEQAFYDKGPVVTSSIKTADGTLQTIEIPIKDITPMVKRCVLFVSSQGSQSVTCEEPTFADMK